MSKRTVLRLAASLGALLLTAASTGHQSHDDHPFKMPDAPAKVVPAPAPWLTGAQLLLQLDPPASAPDRLETIRQASKYLMGVYDATESGLWCYTDGRPRPTPKQSVETMRTATLAYLRGLPRAKLSNKAAALVINMWQYDWPCPPDGCCPGRGY